MTKEIPLTKGPESISTEELVRRLESLDKIEPVSPSPDWLVQARVKLMEAIKPHERA